MLIISTEQKRRTQDGRGVAKFDEQKMLKTSETEATWPGLGRVDKQAGR